MTDQISRTAARFRMGIAVVASVVGLTLGVVSGTAQPSDLDGSIESQMQVARVPGLAAYCDAALFAPLGMSDSSWFLSDFLDTTVLARPPCVGARLWGAVGTPSSVFRP